MIKVSFRARVVIKDRITIMARVTAPAQIIFVNSGMVR